MDLVQVSEYWLYFLGGWVVFGALIIVGQLITFVLWSTDKNWHKVCGIFSGIFCFACAFISTASFVMFCVAIVVAAIQLFKQ